MMTSRDASLVGGSDLRSSDEIHNDNRRSPQRQYNEAAADSSSTLPFHQHSGSVLRHLPEPQTSAGYPMNVSNDSFGQPLGNNTTFASTQPFGAHQSPEDVEQFLSEPPISNRTFTPSIFNHAADALHVSANSSIASTAKTESNSVDVSSSTSLHPMSTVPPLVVQLPQQVRSSSHSMTPLTATVRHQDPVGNDASYFAMTSPSVASSQPAAGAPGGSGGVITTTQLSPLAASAKSPLTNVVKSTSHSGKSVPFSMTPTGVTEKSPSVLMATASSSGTTGNASVTVPRSPSRRTPNGSFPTTSPVSVFAAGPPTVAAKVTSHPSSPSTAFARTNSNHLVSSHGSDNAVFTSTSNSGFGAPAIHSPHQRNSISFNAGVQPPSIRRVPTALPPSSGGVLSPTQREARMSLSRSEGELRHIFSDRGYANTIATPLSSSNEFPGSTVRRLSPRPNSPSLSAGPRQRGVVRAAESSLGPTGMHMPSRHTLSGSSTGSGGGVQPRWLSAVERMKSKRVSEDYSLFDPVLPYDQSKLGMYTRQAGQQGTLTAGKLRALEAQNAGAIKSSDRGGLQPLVAYSVAGTQSTSPTSQVGTPLPTRMPVLTAQEEALQATARHNRGASEYGGNRRTGYVRSSANGGSVSAYGGGRHVVASIPTSSRGYAGGGGVITASETVLGGGSHGSPVSTFMSRSEQGGIPSSAYGTPNSKLGTAEHKLANLFHLRSPSNSPRLRANESTACEVVAAAGSGFGGGSSGGVLRASEEQKAATPRNSSSSAGAGGGGGNGGGGGSSNSNDNTSGNGRKRKPKHVVVAHSATKSKVKELAPEGDEDERNERNFRTRSINALHAIPWDQRRQLPMTGFGTRFFALLSTPRFWEKLDWTVRGSLLTVFPTMVLALEPATTGQFPMASSLAFNAFWITMPTFGSGLRELVIALKGFSFGLIFLIIVVATQPKTDWLVLLLLFVFTLFSSFVAEETKKTTAFVLASTLMQYLTDRKNTDFQYVGQYYQGLLIALAFGTAAFLVPFIRWSSDIARHYIKAMANSLSIDLQGTLSSFWVRSPLERELNVMRLRQLRATAEKCIGKIETALDESGYEPHTGAFMMCMTNRFNFCKSIHNILGSLSQVIELIADNPSSVDTPMCNAFGEQIGDDLAVISSAMDSMVLKICDFERLVTPQEIQFFREARERFQEAVSRVREDVILTNENYETDESDILLGFFMFSVDELCEVISQFEETAHPPNTLLNAILFPIRDIKSVISAFKNLGLTIVRNRTIPRRMKEAIKLAVCMVLPCIFQIYALGNDSVSPMAGAAVIALIYNPTGAESFHYASGRLLGTVLGSLASLLSVQIADGRLWVLYIFIILLSFIGAYVQAAPGFYALGNAIVCSTISVCTQYKNQNAAMVRIQQNCFAILMYFAVVTILWPMQARTKVKMSLDLALRCTRESITRMLRNLDMPDDPNEVTADVSALMIEMGKGVRAQVKFIPGAVEEPTMGSVEYPEDAWKRIVAAERKLWVTLSMMRFAYHTFMSSRADPTTALSVHWVVLHRISPHACDLSDLIYAAIDLYLLSLSNTTIVPTSHLTRLRVGMVEARKAIEDTYIQTISRKVAGEDSDDGDEEENSSFRSSYAGDGGYDDFSGHSKGGQDSNAARPTTTNNRTLTGGWLDDNNNNGGDGGDGGGNAGANSAVVQKSTHEERERREADSTRNAGATEPKKEASRRKSAHHHEGNDSSASSSAASSDRGANDNDDDHHKKSKKKIGYMGYELTKDEEAALRAFVANRVVSNGTFGLNKSMLGNMTFHSRSIGGNTTAAAAAAAALSGGGAKSSMAGSPPLANNDARLMAVRGGDDDLAAMLRKKHHIAVKKEKSAHDDNNEDNNNHSKTSGKWKTGRETGKETHPENLENAPLANSSFLKNDSFFKRISILGGLFNKKPKEGHDLDAEEMRGDDVSSNSISASKKAMKSKREDEHKPPRTPSAIARKGKRVNEGDATSEYGTPSTSPTRSHAGIHSDRQSVASEFSDIEDDPRPNRKSGVRGKSSGVTAAAVAAAKGKGHKTDERLSMACSMPVAQSSKKRTGSRGAANPLEGNEGIAAGGSIRMASSTPVVSSATNVVDVLGGLAGLNHSLPVEASESISKSVPPLPAPHAASSGTVAVVSDPSSKDGNASLTAAGEREPQKQKAPPPAARSATEPTAEAGAIGNPPFDSCDGTPEDGRKAGEELDRRDSSNNSGNTEKKILTGGDPEGGVVKAPASPQKAGKSPGADTQAAKSLRDAKGADEASFHPAAASHRSHSTNSLRYLSFQSASHAGDDSRPRHGGSRAAELLGGMQECESNSMANFDEGEILNNISFFDPEKGEFVLTNHDIHSLEAFLFGTEALVTYINELQKAILEMQHETELAKRL
ncbi:hypothetical protein ABL78_3943 [Leptomonas seymouri]|uniref:Integral membrane bound transporter domain-containing protein n=1 Tax=Leptomonas seymouri TaxID=5684 RepID=A0A0N1HYW9_LEPSE|nr:hypothetical protein ABL78_3943 [Leptomonas seymouri]|eukprot:KPI86990.1 hypothetical protein ABL78_3943 [Leptomonas seymouri]